MKKFLMGTTALVAAGLVAGPASAADPIEISIGGFIEQYFGFADNDDLPNGDPNAINGVGLGAANVNGVSFADTHVLSGSELYFRGSTTLDNGITVSVRIDLETSTSADNDDDVYLALVSDSLGQLRIGQTKHAAGEMSRASPDVGIGLNDGYWDEFVFKGGANDDTVPTTGDFDKVVYYTPRFAGFRVGASFSPNRGTEAQEGFIGNMANGTGDTSWSIGAEYVNSFDGFDIGVVGSYTGNSGDSDLGGRGDEYFAGATIGFSGFTVGGSWGKRVNDTTSGVASTSGANSLDFEGWDIGVSYRTGPYGVSLSYMNLEEDGTVVDSAGEDQTDVIMGSFSYNLGPGVDFRFSAFWVDYDGENLNISANGQGETDTEGFGVVAGMRASF